MARNSIADGETFTLPAPAGGVVAGRIYVFGDLVGVAKNSAAVGVPVVFERHGVWTFDKEPNASGQAWTVGAKLYWDATNNRLTVTLTGNTLVAVAMEAVVTTGTSGRAMLRPLAG
jgi:predicted RecA/RadA family phage recombinase